MIREGRALLGYMLREEALATLAGPSPQDSDSDREQIWQRVKRAAEARPEPRFASPLVKPPTSVQPTLEAIAERPDLKETFAPHKWTVGFADLRTPVLSYQRLVVTDGAEDRVASADESKPATLVELCLPEPQEVQLLGGFDPAQNAYTASALNPNLRVGGFATLEGQNAPGAVRVKFVGFGLSFGSTAVQLVEYRNRWMIRDGYHRVYGLLKRGIHMLPCIVIEARNFEETGAGRPGFFGYELIYGDRPPLVSDFTSDELSASVPVQAVRKIVRVKAEEFVVPV
jgi:hypothetical protein